jgi:hypothetical protein
LKVPLLREKIVARIKQQAVFSHAPFYKKADEVARQCLRRFLDDMLGYATKKQVTATLVKTSNCSTSALGR